MTDSLRSRLLELSGVACVLALGALPLRQAHADEGLIGLYVGGGVGESRIEATLPDSGFDGRFAQNHFSFKAILGVRPISLLGAEVQYLDLGQPDDNEAPYSSVGLRMHGEAAYGMLYLPLVPVVDVYVKAGVSRLQSSVTNGFASSGPNAFTFDRSNTSATEGLGVQYRLGALAFRGDYSLFNAAGGHQNLLTADVTYTFF